MNKCILVAIIAMTFCTFAQANETLWKAVEKAYLSEKPEDWAAVVKIIETDKTIDKYYAPPGEQNVYHYFATANRLELGVLLDETVASVIETAPNPDGESLVMEELLQDEAPPPNRGRSNAVRAAIAISAVATFRVILKVARHAGC